MLPKLFEEILFRRNRWLCQHISSLIIPLLLIWWGFDFIPRLLIISNHVEVLISELIRISDIGVDSFFASFSVWTHLHLWFKCIICTEEIAFASWFLCLLVHLPFNAFVFEVVDLKVSNFFIELYWWFYVGWARADFSILSIFQVLFLDETLSKKAIFAELEKLLVFVSLLSNFFDWKIIKWAFWLSLSLHAWVTKSLIRFTHIILIISTRLLIYESKPRIHIRLIKL